MVLQQVANHECSPHVRGSLHDLGGSPKIEGNGLLDEYVFTRTQGANGERAVLDGRRRNDDRTDFRGVEYIVQRPDRHALALGHLDRPSIVLIADGVEDPPARQSCERDSHPNDRDPWPVLVQIFASNGFDLGAWLRHAPRSPTTTRFSITSTSMSARRKQLTASVGVQTMGSFSLNDVFSTTGTPVSSSKARISFQ